MKGKAKRTFITESPVHWSLRQPSFVNPDEYIIHWSNGVKDRLELNFISFRFAVRGGEVIDSVVLLLQCGAGVSAEYGRVLC